MLRIWLRILLGAACLHGGNTWAQTTQEDLSARLDALIKDAGSDAWATRQKATEALAKLPPQCVPLLDARLRDPALPYAQVELLAPVADKLRPLYAPIRAQEHQKALFARTLKDYQTAYQESGRRDPRWDDHFQRALALDLPSDGHRPTHAEYVKSMAELDAALAAGCTDPGVLRLAALTQADAYGSTEKGDELFRRAWAALEPATYPPLRKFLFMLDVQATVGLPPARYMGTPLTALNTNSPFLRLYRAALETPDIYPDAAADAFNKAESLLMAWRNSEAAAYQALYPSLEKALPNSPIPLIVKGHFYVHYAWEARGNGWAQQVNNPQWKLFADRLDTAEQALTQAYTLDPSQPGAAVNMLEVELGQGKGREVMEMWYRRAMAADPWSAEAPHRKLYYLWPRWHGDHDAMREFGLQCLESADFTQPVAFTLVNAHSEISSDLGNPEGYFQQPAVWNDIQKVYEAAMKARPDDLKIKSEYAYWAIHCEQWEVANQLVKNLDEEAGAAQFGGKGVFHYYQRKAAKNAGGGK